MNDNRQDPGDNGMLTAIAMLALAVTIPCTVLAFAIFAARCAWVAGGGQ